MFGFSLSELIVVIVVALVVIGPKDLPKMLRKLGQYAGKLRRMASELRAQSGIDEALRTEGLADDIAEIRKLARGELDHVGRAVVSGIGPSVVPEPPPEIRGYRDDFYVVRDREYPRDGADSYGALPDNAIVYTEGLPPSKLAHDPIYVLGDPNGVIQNEVVPCPSSSAIQNGFVPEAAPVAPIASTPDGTSDASPRTTPAPASSPGSEVHR